MWIMNSQVNGKDRGVEKEKGVSGNKFFKLLPQEVVLIICKMLDIESLLNASMTCHDWNEKILNEKAIWKWFCLTLPATQVCSREIEDDQNNNFWRETLLKNYHQMCKVKHDWLNGRYSNIRSPDSLPENSMYPMDADTWGEILEAELKR